VAVQGSGLSNQLLSGTRSFASGLLETMLVLFFLLVSGDTFLQAWLTELADRLAERDIRLAYHHHMGTVVETAAESTV
jgi:sugar phosphate isomerase/epimerase